jgi:hypothetical protein
MDLVPREIVYRMGSYLESDTLLQLHQVNQYLSSLRLIRLQFAQVLCQKVGFADVSEIREFINLDIINPSDSTEILQEMSDILTNIHPINRWSALFNRTVRRIPRDLPNRVSFDRVKTKIYWTDLINNYTVTESPRCHHVFRLVKLHYKYIRKYCFTALALIY